MGTLERVFHAVLFEVLAVSLAIFGLALFTEHQLGPLSGTMIVIASIAMLWNFVFNWIFDRFATGEKDKRSLATRIVHVVLFEAGLLMATVPVMAWLLGVGLWEAFIMDIGVTVFITLYAFVFNYVYDHTRAAIIRRRTLAAVPCGQIN